MNFGQVLLLSLARTGPIAVWICLGVLGLGAAVEGLSATFFRPRRPAYRDRASILGFLLTALMLAGIPACLLREFGSLRGHLPDLLAGLLAALGILGTFLSTLALGWASLVMRKQLHFTARVEAGDKLLQEGPFAHVRHPMYFGIALLFASSALATLNWVIALLALLWWPLAQHRAAREDRLLAQAFGPVFEHYRRKVPGLWPR